MNDCTKCATEECGCDSGFQPVMPPSECGTAECPSPEPCSEIIPTTCVQHIGEDVSCGEDTVYEQGDTIAEINEKIVNYFCGLFTDLEYVESVTGDGVDNADPQNPVIDLSAYALTADLNFVETVTGDGVNNADPQNPVINLSAYVLTADLAPVAFSGDYGDLINTPTVSNFANANLTLTADRTHDFDNFSMTLNDVTLFKINGETQIKTPSASSAVTVFGVRNFTDTAWLVRQVGNGRIAVNGNPLGNARFYVTAIAGEISGYFEAVDEDGVYGESSSGRGIRGMSSSNYGGDFTSTTSYAVRAGSGVNGQGFLYQITGTAGKSALNLVDGVGDRVFNVTNDGRLVSDYLKNSTSYANDAAAALGGIEISQLYRNGSVVQLRIT